MTSIVRIGALFVAALSLVSCQDTRQVSSKPTAAPDAPRSLSAMEWVTGLHTHFIEGTGFEFRLIEVDGSGTVAMNPIYLYLVVTNNGGGGMEQSRMVTLPNASKIEKVHFFGSEPRLEIDVLLDRFEEQGHHPLVVQEPATLVVTANIAKERLKGDIEVVVRKPGGEAD